MQVDSDRPSLDHPIEPVPVSGATHDLAEGMRGRAEQGASLVVFESGKRLRQHACDWASRHRGQCGRRSSLPVYMRPSASGVDIERISQHGRNSAASPAWCNRSLGTQCLHRASCLALTVDWLPSAVGVVALVSTRGSPGLPHYPEAVCALASTRIAGNGHRAVCRPGKPASAWLCLQTAPGRGHDDQNGSRPDIPRDGRESLRAPIGCAAMLSRGKGTNRRQVAHGGRRGTPVHG
jgi:hypothetical protein